MHKALYRDGLTLEQARARIAEIAGSHPEAVADVAMMQDFLAGMTPQRGIVR
jgi:UDP-N-acetylglucosamine acyltransferase